LLADTGAGGFAHALCGNPVGTELLQAASQSLGVAGGHQETGYTILHCVADTPHR
jgi:hypothetical protein